MHRHDGMARVRPAVNRGEWHDDEAASVSQWRSFRAGVTPDWTRQLRSEVIGLGEDFCSKRSPHGVFGGEIECRPHFLPRSPPVEFSGVEKTNVDFSLTSPCQPVSLTLSTGVSPPPPGERVGRLPLLRHYSPMLLRPARCQLTDDRPVSSLWCDVV